MQHMFHYKLFSDNQHGFLPNKSCISQLLTAMDHWTESLNSGYPVNIIYFDFNKAFDSVPHNMLLTKLRSYRICGNLLSWLCGFLIGRKQWVTLNNIQSRWSDVSGVPQGSVLGPVLFLLYVNNILLMVNSNLLLFTDDIKLYRSIKSEVDITQLQEDINSLFRWSNSWLLTFNIPKCKVLHIGSSTLPQTYTLSGTPLDNVYDMKDLGIIIDSQLKFHLHSAHVVSKANRLLGLIKKSFEHITIDTLPLLYKTLIRPILEYGNSIWGPHFILDQQAVERTQRRATRMIQSLKDLPYHDRLCQLNLPSLTYRRRRGDMILMYQLTHNLINIPLSALFTFSSYTSTRGHDFKLFKPHSRCRSRQSFFCIRVISDWNNLPDNIVNATSLNHFKNLLDNYWSNILYNFWFSWMYRLCLPLSV